MPKEWTRGTTKAWNREEGWGVNASPDVGGDVWAHFSAVIGDGYRELRVGDAVEFRYEERGQDGYHYAAVSVRRQGNAP
jgi:CspA family cold shock protein